VAAVAAVVVLAAVLAAQAVVVLVSMAINLMVQRQRVWLIQVAVAVRVTTQPSKVAPVL
jgi:hypothetical protein